MALPPPIFSDTDTVEATNDSTVSEATDNTSSSSGSGAENPAETGDSKAEDTTEASEPKTEDTTGTNDSKTEDTTETNDSKTEDTTEASEPKTEISTDAVVPADTDTDAKQDFTYEESGIQLELHLSSAVAADAALSVEALDPDNFENETFETWAEDQTILGASIYDIHLADADGNEIETGETTVKMQLSDVAVPEAEGAGTTLTFLHITDDGIVEEGTVSEDGTSAEITANGLSPFVFVRTAGQEDGILTADGTTKISVASAEDLNAAVETINNGTGDYTLYLIDDITTTSSVSITKNRVTIIGNGHTINFEGAEVAICVNSSTTDKPVLILGDAEDSSNKLTLNGDNVARDGGHLIAVAGTGSVAGNGTVKIYAGTTLQNAISNNTFGGAIVVGQGGYLEMNGGTITNCGVEGGSVNFGGGVAVISGGSFTMNGGSISDCYAETDYDSGWQVPAGAGGAVFVGQGSTFTMNGGSLTDNRASTDGGAVAVIGSLDKVYDMGGYGYLDSRFEMNAGTISGNSAGYVGGGVAALGTYIEAYGLCSATAAAGRPENPGIYINGGSISSNHANEGGGVFLNWIRGSIPVQIHNVAIRSNTAENGAGIEVMSYWTQADIDGCTIEGNESVEKGAGIYLKGNSSSSGTTLKDTSVKDNKSGAIGAGIYYDADSKLTISGQNTIQNNTYNGVINNLNIFDASHPVYVNGSLKGSSIGLSDPTLWNDNLSDSDSTALSTAKLTSGFKEYNEGLDPEDVFTSDHSTWAPDYGEKKEDTKRMDYSSTASTWSDIKVMDTVWVTPSMDTYSGLKTLYYNPTTGVYSIDSSSSYKVAMIEKDETYYLAYNNGTNYYILKSLSGKPEYRTYSLGGRNMTYGHFPSDLSIDGYDYIRSNDFTTASVKSIFCYELTEISNGDGYDYTNEVRLTRGYAIIYKDGEAEADFGTVKHPTTYRNEEVTLVAPVEKSGYEFKGWYRDAAFTDGPITALGAGETPDENKHIVLYAKYTEKTYTVKYMDGDAAAEFDTDNYPKVYKKGSAATLVNPKDKDGYTFAGWYRDADLKDGPITELSADETIDENGNIILYAKWTKTEKPVEPVDPVNPVTPDPVNPVTPDPVNPVTPDPVVPVTPDDNSDKKTDKKKHHSHSSTTSEETATADTGTVQQTDNANTGDQNHILVWFLLLCITSVGILIPSISSKKKKKDNSSEI